MAEQLLADNSWSAKLELTLPDGGSPQPIGWEDNVQRRAREERVNQAAVVDKVQGDGPATDENTEQLAVFQEQVKANLHVISNFWLNFALLQEETVPDTEEIPQEQVQARKRAEARMSMGRKLKNQLHNANQEVRQATVLVSEVAKKLVSAQREVTSKRASLGRKRMEIMRLKEEMRSLELEEIRWMQEVNTTQLEQIGLEEARVEKTTIAMDVMARLTCHLTENTEFGCLDIRETVELHTEGRLAMN